ncbi:hypothetical protein FQN55_004229 [Onygenales sp. PD_40]|nr:hypothetical protein FQN55_004229 [Onygenales sp. PD_40]
MLSFLLSIPPRTVLSVLLPIIASCLGTTLLYRLYLHPLAKFHGPWYAAATSLTLATLSLFQLDALWIEYLVKKYGSESPLLRSSLAIIFNQCNTKASLYGTGAFASPHLFGTLDGDSHRELRKAVGGSPWTVGCLKNNWEPRLDDHLQLLCQRLTETANTHNSVDLGSELSRFSADIATMLLFTHPFGFLENRENQARILEKWREEIPVSAFASRFKFFHVYIANLPGMNALLFRKGLPRRTGKDGSEWVMAESARRIKQREYEIEQGRNMEKSDFLQLCMDARLGGKPLTQAQKHAHAIMFLTAGSDTTGSGLGSTLRFLITQPDKLQRLREEIETAEQAGLLSKPIKYEEARQHLPYLAACIKESLRLNPPGVGFFARVTGKDGTIINGQYIPPHTEITTAALVIHRDPGVFSPDPGLFRPERWLDKDKVAEMDPAIFTFGMGPRSCLGKDIAHMELYKVIAELVRRFDFKLENAGEFVIAGGIAYNKGFKVKITLRK